MKKWVVLLCSGAVLGHLSASIVAPKMLSWYFKPPIALWADCSPAVTWGVNRLMWIQLVGLLVGCILFSLIGLKFFKKPMSREDSMAES